jgi:hypothetical protein
MMWHVCMCAHICKYKRCSLHAKLFVCVKLFMYAHTLVLRKQKSSYICIANTQARTQARLHCCSAVARMCKRERECVCVCICVCVCVGPFYQPLEAILRRAADRLFLNPTTTAAIASIIARAYPHHASEARSLARALALSQTQR